MMKTPRSISNGGPQLIPLATVAAAALIFPRGLPSASGFGWDAAVATRPLDRPRRPLAFPETTHRVGGHKRALVIVASSDGGDDGSPLFGAPGGGESDLPPGFNPFDRKPLSSERRVDSLSLMSVRKLKMKKVMEELLRSANDDEAMEAVLTENEDFLCEQLNDLDAVLDMDSIYEPDMGREERYRRYGEVMDERIAQARDSGVRKILRSMKDFVMAYDERHA